MTEWHCGGCGNVTYGSTTTPQHPCSGCGKRSWTKLTMGKRDYKCRKCGNIVEWSTTTPSFACLGCVTRSWQILK